MTVARPSLDDVYLHYTGRAFSSDDAEVGRDSVFSDGGSGFLFRRLALNLQREPIWIALMLIQPMFWLLLYSQLFRRITDLPGFGTTDYIDYLAPGIAIMTAFFSGSWAGMGTIEDLDRGVIERFLATPAKRTAIVGARTVQSATTATTQALIILLVSLVLGATNGGPVGWIVILLASALVAAGFSGISNGLALLTRQDATMIALSNFISLPLLFFSSILIARNLMPSWMETLSTGNPVEWSVRAGRGGALPGTSARETVLYLVLLAGFCVAHERRFATLCFRSYRRTLVGEYGSRRLRPHIALNLRAAMARRMHRQPDRFARPKRAVRARLAGARETEPFPVRTTVQVGAPRRHCLSSDAVACVPS